MDRGAAATLAAMLDETEFKGYITNKDELAVPGLLVAAWTCAKSDGSLLTVAVTWFMDGALAVPGPLVAAWTCAESDGILLTVACYLHHGTVRSRCSLALVWSSLAKMVKLL